MHVQEKQYIWCPVLIVIVDTHRGSWNMFPADEGSYCTKRKAGAEVWPLGMYMCYSFYFQRTSMFYIIFKNQSKKRT